MSITEEGIETVFQRVCQDLDFMNSVGFCQIESDTNNLNQKLLIQEAREKVGVDAIYFYQPAPNSAPIPIIYFKKLEEFDEIKIKELHRNAWSQCQASILFVITPLEIRLYNCFEKPSEYPREDVDNGDRLIQKLNLISDATVISQELNKESLEREILEEYGVRFDPEKRADKYLLENLRNLRENLLNKGIDYKIVNNIIGRSIFILYLEDRHALDDIYRIFEGGIYNSFKEILTNKDHTYEFFQEIQDQFGGDIFPPSSFEQQQITKSNLRLLRQFLCGTNIKSKQARLFPIRYDIIPIEFIGKAYEEFIKTDYENDPIYQRFSHHTPQFLVEFLLNQIFSTEINDASLFLDPACGSGTFLVNLCRRIVYSRFLMRGIKPSLSELQGILTDQIYGIDINEDAIKIAAFSLYLTMLDFLDSSSIIQYKDILPKLLGTSLIVANFLQFEDIWNGKPFDFIIGNAPWGKDKDAINDFKIRNSDNFIVGKDEISQAFLWQATKFVKPDSTICLIVTAKGLLYNQIGTNAEFRNTFFEKNDIKILINFTAMRNQLFDAASHPASAVIYSTFNSGDNKDIIYITPKSLVELRKFHTIVINYSDVKKIPYSYAMKDMSIWKMALWGNPRDWSIIKKMREHAIKLGDYEKILNLIVGDGFKKGGVPKESKFIEEFKFLDPKLLTRFRIPNELSCFDINSVARPRILKQQIYFGPHCLVRKAPNKKGPTAAYSDENLCFKDSIIGISAPAEFSWFLKIITIFLNSTLTRYYLFLTSSRWGIDRGNYLVRDFLELPIIMPDLNSEETKKLLKIYNDFVTLANNQRAGSKEWLNLSAKVDKIFFNLFEISEDDIKIIQDLFNTSLDIFYSRLKSRIFLKVEDSNLEEYVRTFQNVINIMLNQKASISSLIYIGFKDLIIIEFSLKYGESDSTVLFKPMSSELEDLLKKLQKLMLNVKTGKINFARIIKIYERDKIYLIKPREDRFWTLSLAYKDADDTVIDILGSWRGREDYFRHNNDNFE